MSKQHLTEGKLKAKLVAHLRRMFPEWVIFAHQEMTTHGVPDLSITGGEGGGTTWIECKLANPALKSKGVQDVTCLKLEAAGRNCWYVIWYEAREYVETLIVTPLVVFEDRWLKDYVERANGISHDLVAAFLVRMSERRRKGAVGD